jgi:hypothetical protein
MENRWIRSGRWDLTWLVGSVLTVPLAPLMFEAFRAWWGMGERAAANGVATVIMLAVGGPHVFVTFTRTNMDPRFVRNHQAYSRLVYLIPVATAVFAFTFTSLFLTLFFTWASLHVLQQIAYVTNCYTNRQRLAPGRLEKWIEYGLIFSCLYPFATVRMVEGTFMLDGTKLLVPEVLLGPGLVYASFAIFGAFLAGWLWFTVQRARRGTLHYGKTALLGATVGATFFTPLFPNLDVAFQGINTWHCVQYLALIWWANRLRRERGATELPFVRALSEGGWKGFARYYGASVGITAAVVAVIYLVSEWAVPTFWPEHTEVSFLLAYYMIGKGLLLSHYYYDTFLFTQRDELTAPSGVALST